MAISTIWQPNHYFIATAVLGISAILCYNVDASHSTFNDIGRDQNIYNLAGPSPADSNNKGGYATGIKIRGSSSVRLHGNTITVVARSGKAHGVDVDDESDVEMGTNRISVNNL